MVTVLWTIAAILCVALCAYGIATAVGRGADRRAQGTRAPTQRCAPVGRSRRVPGCGGSCSCGCSWSAVGRAECSGERVEARRPAWLGGEQAGDADLGGPP